MNTLSKQLREQIQRHWGKTAVLYSIAVLLCLLVVIINRLFAIPVASLVRDPTSLGAVAPWTGAFSNIGILFWCAAMTLAFAGATLVYQKRGHDQYFSFLIASGLVTGYLMLDDLFVLHESLRDYLGFPEQASFAIIIIMIMGYLLGYRRSILSTDYYFLAMALLLLGASLGLDNIQYTILNYLSEGIYYLIEDGLKLVGIINWFGYFSGIFTRLASGQLGKDLSSLTINTNHL